MPLTPWLSRRKGHDVPFVPSQGCSGQCRAAGRWRCPSCGHQSYCRLCAQLPLEVCPGQPTLPPAEPPVLGLHQAPPVLARGSTRQGLGTKCGPQSDVLERTQQKAFLSWKGFTPRILNKSPSVCLAFWLPPCFLSTVFWLSGLLARTMSQRHLPVCCERENDLRFRPRELFLRRAVSGPSELLGHPGKESRRGRDGKAVPPADKT